MAETGSCLVTYCLHSRGMVGEACCEASSYPFPPSRLDLRTFSSSSICSHLHTRDPMRAVNIQMQQSRSLSSLFVLFLFVFILFLSPPQILSEYLKGIEEWITPRMAPYLSSRMIHWGLGICFFRIVLQPMRIEKHKCTCLLLSLICSFA